MNGRPFAMERGPVLAPAWSTPTPESGYHRHQMPEMPAAAAAAISPIVPAAAPPDPYARCWPAGQVDTGTCFPYFGALYSSSLPSPSYRVQPGCMANLGQFWPPTPPPDGCGRYEGAGNLYFCSPLTPVFRHSESVPQNIRTNYPGLGPYSHLVDVHKEQALHSHRFKRENSASPKTSVSYMTVCPSMSKPESAAVTCISRLKKHESSPESVHKHEIYASKKCSRSNQQKLCRCCECVDKNVQGSANNVDKENINDSSSISEQRYSDDRVKVKNHSVMKESGISLASHRSSPYSVNVNPVQSFNSSSEQQPTRLSVSSNFTSGHLGSVSSKNFMHGTDSAIERSNSTLHYSFPRSDDMHNRCISRSSYPLSPIDSSYQDSPAKMQRHKLQMSAPSYESCACSAQYHVNPIPHSKGDKGCCYAPSQPLPQALYTSPSDNLSYNQKNNFLVHNNNFNVSPLKNVYFSHIESENYHLTDNHNFLAYCSKQNKEKSADIMRKSALATCDGTLNFSNSSPATNVFSSVSTSVKNSHSQMCSATSICHCTSTKDASSKLKKNLSSSGKDNDDVSVIADRFVKPSAFYIKQEKPEISDCKFQTYNSNQRVPRVEPTSDCLNLSASVRSPKIEPADLTCSSATMQNWSSLPPNKVLYADAISLQKAKVTSSHITESRYFENGLPYSRETSLHNFKVSEIHGLPPSRIENRTCIPEDIVSVAQTAPIETDFVNSLCENASNVHQESSQQSVCMENEKFCDGVNSATSSIPSSGRSENCPSKVEKEEFIANALEPCNLKVEKESNEPLSAESVSSGLLVEKNAISSSNALSQQHSSHTDCSTYARNAEVELPIKIKAEPESDTEVENAEEMPSDDCKTSFCLNAIKSEPVQNEFECMQSGIQNETPDVKDVAKVKVEEENIEQSNFDEYNGLYLLLHSIDLTSNENSRDVSSTKIDKSDNNEPDKCNPEKLENSSDSPVPDLFSNLKSSPINGLSALCALAEHCIAAEFQDKMKIAENSEQFCEQKLPEISSNYPVIKEESTADSGQNISQSNSSKCDKKPEESKELQTRKKLAELQTQYKEVQKELARLKSKRNLVNRHPRNRSAGSENAPGAAENSGISEYSSEDCSFSADNASTESHLRCRNSAKSSVSQYATSVQVKDSANIPETANSSSDDCCSREVVRNQDSNSDCSQSSSARHRSTSKNSGMSTETPRRFLLRNRNSDVIMISSTISKKSRNKSETSSARKSSSRKNIGPNSNTSCADKSTENDSCQSFSRRSQSGKETSVKQKSSKISTKTDSNHSSKRIKHDTITNIAGLAVKANKRKPENPKRYSPAKKGKMTETIVAKQLRNRILFETYSCTSDEDLSKEESDVPKELSDALRKCHLNNTKKNNQNGAVFSPEDDIPLSVLSQNTKLDKLCEVTSEHLVENQRILAMEDGLFYAGCIKEIPNPDVFGIALDGQRGNKVHIFSREEMLTETLLELKPTSMDELPEGTRVCAYWSQQYRCLYPGTVVKASSPSADWSEPRVFVAFDDGDSGQIPLKNIRFLPQNSPIFVTNESQHSPNTSSDTVSENKLKSDSLSTKSSKRGRDLRKHSKVSKKGHQSKRNSEVSKTDTSQDESFCPESDIASSQNSGNRCLQLDMSYENIDSSMNEIIKQGRKASKRQSKKNSGLKLKSKSNYLQIKNKAEKCKKHKKYKERHKHHHHHHRHHHHHHSHRHHHSKKHKHHRRAHANCTDFIVLENSYENMSIPSTSIPYSNSNTVSTGNPDDCVKSAGHSGKEKLPQLTSTTILGTAEKSIAKLMSGPKCCSTSEYLPSQSDSSAR